VTYGVLTCYNEKQALERSSQNGDNKGREAALAALEMIGQIAKEAKQSHK
jgi:6,7-dimethyl-8-ribityllumazine synthase